MKKTKRTKIGLLGGIALAIGVSATPAHVYAVTDVSPAASLQQQKTQRVVGVVRDHKGEPIIGAVVTAAGRKAGAVTDTDGRFTVEVAPGSELHFTCIGFKPTVVRVNGNTTQYNIVMEEDNQALDEVVVVGYGTQKKVNLTGSVASISSDKLANRVGSDVTNMLTGLMPGVTVIQNSSMPGSDQGIMRVRGLGTMGDASAMVIVDGVESTMSSVNPNDIENISVLKDAAASAIYGVRAANGVVLITTKRGSKGRTDVSYDGYVGWQQATRMPKYLDSYITRCS